MSLPEPVVRFSAINNNNIKDLIIFSFASIYVKGKPSNLSAVRNGPERNSSCQDFHSR